MSVEKTERPVGCSVFIRSKNEDILPDSKILGAFAHRAKNAKKDGRTAEMQELFVNSSCCRMQNKVLLFKPFHRDISADSTAALRIEPLP